ncbi:CPBP family intramembrane glutamic endopeptidase [Actinopolymorpha alba]|uniref:CPBP family intramembrane glutamic endopeptidase n=1 Tax=Actinopolymorpha alba TaxID=533267 RepID=UPI000364C080|nr:CPBP family intramembrane glutamic endopeptidase [Actinopolymorpha alba]
MGIAPEFSTLAVVLSIPLLAVLVVDPLLGRRMYDRLQRHREHDSQALKRVYRRILIAEWSCAAVVVLIITVSPGAALADFGLALPDTWFDVDVLPRESSEIAGAVVGLLVVGTVLLLLSRRLAKVNARPAGGIKVLQQAGLDTFNAIIPRTATERRLAIAVSVTAGVCEELIYRGFLIAFGVGVLNLNVYVAAGLAALLFGAAHLYQGWLGMIRVTFFGVLMTALYLSTGSLVLPIVIHAVGDIVSLVVMPSVSRTNRTTVQEESARIAEVS